MNIYSSHYPFFFPKHGITFIFASNFSIKKSRSIPCNIFLDVRNLIVLLLMISGISLQGQIDTLMMNDTLPQIVVTGYVKTNVHTTAAVSAKKNHERHYVKELKSLSELLNNHSAISLKNYGPGSLNTISLRGHSASQTDISLDGFSIQSNMNGVYDLSLIPSYFLEYVAINPSANSAGINGTIGGNLALKTNDKLNNKENLALEYISSFGSYTDIGNYFSLGTKWGKAKKQHFIFRPFHRSSKNNFPYENLNQIGRPTVKLTNSDFRQYGFQQNNFFELNNNNIISTKFWYVNNHRKIPPTLTQNSSSAFQNDALINGIVSWEKDWSTKYKTEWSNRYMNEHIYYDSPGIQSDSRAQKYETRAKLDYEINKNNRLSTTVGHEYSLADVDDYAIDTPIENRSYALVSYDFEKENIAVGLQVKEELTEKKLSPFLFSIRGKYNIKRFSVSTNISKNYRRPTFNDLYWNSSSSEGGNPSLVPEDGWKEELAFSYFTRNTNFFIQLNLFNSNVKNWILWSPNETGAWTPDNVKEVWSRGLETEMNYYLKINSNSQLKFNSRYNFTKTTNTKVFNNSENTLDKQLIYVPLHSGDISFDINYKNLFLKYNQILSGKRFITTTNSSFVPRYAVSNIQLSYLFAKKKIEIEPVFEIRNLFNKKYQIVANRPLPPIHFQGTIHFRFRH